MRQSDQPTAPGAARLLLTAALALGACLAHAKDPSYVGSVHTVGTDAVGAVARGTVFLDANRNSRLDTGERGIADVDNLDELYAIVGDRPALGLSGHTHTIEQIMPGEHFHGWQENTGTGPAQFHQIVTGAVSGSWWAGDLDDAGIPHATQRLGSPRGYYVLDFDGADYVDTYLRFGGSADQQFHASFNTPRFRRWAADLFAYVDLHGAPSEVPPPVTINDLGDMNMLTHADLGGGTWVAVNVWNGSRQSMVSVAVDGGAPIAAARTQPGTGEGSLSGPEYADPWAVALQSTNGRMAVRNDRGGDDTAGFTTWRGTRWSGVAGPFQAWMLTRRSSHL